MKLSNNPSRKNERRKRALAQLMHPKNTKAQRLDRPPGFNRFEEIDRIQQMLMFDHVARSIRTKKDRSARGKLR